jgi:zinc D-Ala-D-Ala carboxypeptidase
MIRTAASIAIVLVLAGGSAACSEAPGPSGAPGSSGWATAIAAPNSAPTPPAPPTPSTAITPTETAQVSTPSPITDGGSPSNPATSPDAGVPPPSLDRCVYVDVPAPNADYADWARTLVDTYFTLPPAYEPVDLVSTGQAGLSPDFAVRSLVIPDLAAMADAAEAAGAPIDVESAFRTYAMQASTFASWVATYGYQAALKFSARPGHSEHQLGTTLDFRSAGVDTPFDGDWATTPAGAWMMAHAWGYGFVLSYPMGQSGVSCYDYEPWHYRYFGRPIAAVIHASGLVERAWLWTHQ